MKAPALKLSDGNSIPHLGLGTWPMQDDEVAPVIVDATSLGYRLFDTAVNYRNENGVGAGIRLSSVEREELFITTKIPGRHHGYQETWQSLEESLARLQLDYVDLCLIHWPNPSRDKYVDTWRAFIDLQKEGKVRSIGVSNFKAHHIDRLLDETGVMPAVNQIQLYPAVTQPQQRHYDEQHGIVTQSWSPLGLGANVKYYSGIRTFLDHPTLQEIAAEHGKTSGQVVLRWHVQLGLVPLPKSSNRQRLADNLDVFSFALTNEEIQRISSIDDGRAEVADSDEHEEL